LIILVNFLFHHFTGLDSTSKSVAPRPASENLGKPQVTKPIEQSVDKCLSYEFEPRSWRGVLDTTLCDKVCQRLATGRWFSPVSTTKTDHHDITEILLKLKVELNTKQF
jgi:hypothetical protein